MKKITIKNRLGLFKRQSTKSGFTLVEIVVDIAIIGLVAVAVLSAYSAGFRTMELAKAKIAAVAAANEKMEEIRNMPYDSLATEHGQIYPPGNLLDDQEIQRKGVRFNVHTIIQYIDDPFDGCADTYVEGIPKSECLEIMQEGKPRDLYPYDYKKVEIRVSKIGRSGFLSQITSNVSAKAAETPGNSGIIKLCVIDASGAPVPEADITITNPYVDPPADIAATTGIDGCIMVPNLPPNSQNKYHLTATKAGYSTDLTSPRTAQNPNAEQPDVDVSVQQVTPKTLIIDKLSTLKIDFVDELNNPLPNLAFHIEGAKLLYFNPETHKYSANLVADANGHVEIPNMEFDDYSISISGRHVVSTTPYQPIGLSGDTVLSVKVASSASASLPRITACNPSSGKIGETVLPVISGANFQNGASVKLVFGAVEINGFNIVVSHGDTAETEFDLAGAAEGMYDIVITNPDGSSIRQERGFEVKTN